MFLLLPSFSNLLLAVRAAARRGRAENARYVWGGEGSEVACVGARRQIYGLQQPEGGRSHVVRVTRYSGERTRTLVHKATAHTEQPPADARS